MGREEPLRPGERHARLQDRRQVARVVLEDPVQARGGEHDVGLLRAGTELRAAADGHDTQAPLCRLPQQLGRALVVLRDLVARRQNRSATPARSSGCSRYGPGTSPQSRGVGITFPGFASPAGSNAQRRRWNASRSASENISGM